MILNMVKIKNDFGIRNDLVDLYVGDSMTRLFGCWLLGYWVIGLLGYWGNPGSKKFIFIHKPATQMLCNLYWQ